MVILSLNEGIRIILSLWLSLTTKFRGNDVKRGSL